MNPPSKSVVPKCVLVLGMHRSGTSAFTGLLCRFGAIPGKDLLPANDSNPKGFFESRTVVDINNAILQAVGSSWDDMKALPTDWHHLPAMQPLRESISAWLSSPDGAAGLRVIKDPRLSKTLPLWLDVMAGLGIQPVVVVCVREPAAVAQSEKLMKGFPVLKSLLLYLDYGLQAELHSRGIPRAFVAYVDLLTDWPGVLQRVDAELGLGLPLDTTSLQTRGQGFVSPDLNRSEIDMDEFQRCGTLAEMACALHEILRLAVPIAEQIDILRRRFIEYQYDIQPWGVVLQYVQAVEDRYPNVNLGRRYSCSRMQSRLAWADSQSGEFDPDNVVSSKWVYGADLQSVRLSFNRSCIAGKFRLTFVNRPAYVRIHSLVLYQDAAVLSRWEHLHESLVGRSRSAFDLTFQSADTNDAWLFLDGKGYVDINISGSQQIDLDQRCYFVMNIEVNDISAALKPLLLKVSQLQKKLDKLRKNFVAQESQSKKVKIFTVLSGCFSKILGVLKLKSNS